MLIILDGLGYGKNDSSNAVKAANTPFIDHLLTQYPNSKLAASGTAVGLPEGQMGNSEVGHMNLGAGRIVYQELGRIHKAVEDGELITNPVIQNAFSYARENGKNVHLIGLVSDGGVHAHTKHLRGLCEAAIRSEVPNTYIHAFLDGRDTDPHSGYGYIEDLENYLTGKPIEIASVIGRYYAMDRDNRWERVKQAYDLLVYGKGKPCSNLLDAIRQSYDEGITDEFVQAIVKTDQNGNVLAKIANGDVVICFNFRTDRGREITIALTQKAFPDYDLKPLDLHYITLTKYDESFKGIKVVFEKEDVVETMGEVLEKNGKSQVRIAETEKYPHVTFFFSGGREKVFEGESRILIPSPKVATYDLQPEMSAHGITEAICAEVRENHPDFVCLNFANPDMVGHTGSFEAVVKAIETVDGCTKQVVETGLQEGYSFIILADHGNSEFMVNEDGSPNTAHTTNLVPCILIDDEFGQIKDGKLGDVAPTLLRLLHVPVPEKMTGTVLVSN